MDSETLASARLTRGTAICVTATVLWSSTAIFIRYLTDRYGLPPLVLAFWRDAFVCVALFVAFMVTGRRRLRLNGGDLKFLVLYGLVLSLFNSVWTISITLNGAAVSTVLAYSSAGFTAILGWRLFGEQLGPRKLLAVAGSLAGLVFVSGAYDLSAWRLNAFGISAGVLSGLAFSVYSLMGRAASYRAINPWTTLFYTFGFASLFLLAYNLLPGLASGTLPTTNLFWLGGSLVGWGVLLLLAVGPTIGGYGLYTVSLTYLPASLANLIATLEPAMTAVVAYIFLHERLTGLQITGSALIVGSVLILQWMDNRYPAPRAEAPV